MVKPPGTKQKPMKGSWNEWLYEFKVGERRYVETTLETYAHDMRIINTPLSRRPEALTGFKFSTSLFTAFGSDPRDIRRLLCVERVA